MTLFWIYICLISPCRKSQTSNSTRSWFCLCSFTATKLMGFCSSQCVHFTGSGFSSLNLEFWLWCQNSEVCLKSQNSRILTPESKAWVLEVILLPQLPRISISFTALCLLLPESVWHSENVYLENFMVTMYLCLLSGHIWSLCFMSVTEGVEWRESENTLWPNLYITAVVKTSVL